MKNRIFSVLLCLLLVAATTLPALSPILAPVEVQAKPGDGVIGFKTNNLVFTAACIAGYGSTKWSQDNLWWTNRTDSWAYNAECAYDGTIDALHLYGKSGGGRIRFNLNSVLSARGGSAQAMSNFNAIRLIYRPYQGAVDSSIGVQVHSSAAPSSAAKNDLGLSTSDGIYKADFGFGTLGGNLDCVLIDLEGRLWLYAIMLFKVDTTNGGYNYYNTCCKQHGAVNLIFDGNGGSGHSPTQSGAQWSYQGKTVSYPAASAPSRMGYRFNCWMDGTGSTKAAKEGIALTTFNTGGIASATWTAQWDANYYTVNYNGNGADGGATAASGHYYGTNSSLRANGFTRTGYRFSHWTDGNGTTISSADNLTATHNGSVTLYAQWAANYYTVNYNGNGADGGSTAATGHYYGTNSALATNGFTRTGYRFSHWTNSSGTQISSANNLVSDHNGSITLYAAWVANDYTVSYNGNGNTGGSTAPTAHKYGTSSSLASNGFTKTGYSFVNWTDANGNTVSSANNLTATHNGTVTLYAKWQPNSNTITYVYGNGSADTTQNYNTATNPTLPGTPSRTGYTFTGWKVTSVGSECNWTNGATYGAGDTVPDTGLYGNVTLTAQWTAHKYTVTYDANTTDPSLTGSTASSSHTYDVAQGLTANGYARPGYTFAGWNTESDGSGTTYGDNVSVSNLTTENGANVKLYAQWTPVEYTLTLNTNDGSEATSTTYTIEQIVNLTTPTRVGYTFGGWKVTTANGSWTLDEVYSGTHSFDVGQYGDVTLTAQWTANTYTIHYELDGGSFTGDEAPNSYTHGTATPIPGPTRPGYDFTGWQITALDVDATGWEVGDMITAVPANATGNATLTAQWEQKGVPVRYQLLLPVGTNPESFSLTYYEDFVLFDTGVVGTGSKVNPLPDGYAFAGWYTDIDCEVAVDPTWVDENGELMVNLENVDIGEWQKSYTFYAKVDYDTKAITLSATCTENPEQTFIYKITGTPVLTDVFGETVSLEVTLLAGESLQVVMPLGDYVVTEYTDWSWRYADTQDNDETEDVECDVAVISRYDASVDLFFTYSTPTNTMWLNGGSAAAGTGKEAEITS